MIRHAEQRVGVFVDVQNMYYSAKNLYGKKVNFGEILKEAIAGRKLIRALVYVIRSQSPEENSFFQALDKQGFEVRSKDLLVYYGGLKKGDWDLGIAMDAIRMADRLDSVVLVTGDGDFRSLVQYLQMNKGCLVEVIAFAQSASTKLTEEADAFLDLSQDVGRFLIVDPKASRAERTPRHRNGTSAKTSTQTPTQTNEPVLPRRSRTAS